MASGGSDNVAVLIDNGYTIIIYLGAFDQASSGIATDGPLNKDTIGIIDFPPITLVGIKSHCFADSYTFPALFATAYRTGRYADAVCLRYR